MLKKLVVLFIGVTLVLGLSGCGVSLGDSEVQSLSSLEGVESESNVQSVSLSATDKEQLIYNQVSDRTLLDVSSLESPTSSEVELAENYMDSVDAQLSGQLSADNGVIDSNFTDYLLFEFEKTPSYWQRSEMVVLGVDSVSRSIVLDVTYKTIDFAKTVKSSSLITKGEPNYTKKLEVRLERYCALLDESLSMDGSTLSSDYYDSYSKFEETYGSISSILEEQQVGTLTDTVFKYGNQITYTGLVNNELESGSGEIVVRYILTPEYSLGINLGLDCTHMYVVSYSLDVPELETEEFVNSSYDDVTGISDEVRKVLTRYYICTDDENFTGLYSLISDFSSLDKYYSDMFNTSFHKFEDVTVTVHSVTGTRVVCTASVTKKIRAIGSEMTLPIYTDNYYYVLSLSDGSLKIEDEILLSSVLEGEPAITTDDAEVSGFSTSIDLTSQDKQDMEKLIADFGVLQLSGDVISEKFSKVVDTSISSSQLTALRTDMLELDGVQKVVWLTSYLQGFNSYASISCKELLQKEDGTLYECSATYDFIKKGNSWYVYGYTLNEINALSSTNIATKNSLCIVTPDGITLFESKVTVSDTTGSDEEVVGVVIDYPSVIPTIKIQSDTSELESSETLDTSSDLETDEETEDIDVELTKDQQKVYDALVDAGYPESEYSFTLDLDSGTSLEYLYGVLFSGNDIEPVYCSELILDYLIKAVS